MRIPNIRPARFLQALLLAIPCAAQTEFFPLQLGNQWIYQTGGRWFNGSRIVVDIPRANIFEGREYAELRGLPEGNLWLRMGADGTLYRYNPEGRTESVWAVFSTPAGGTYRTAVDPCNQTAHVESRNARVKVPVGEYENALEIRYPSANCADAGLAGEFYLPYIGLIQRESITIAGPRTMSLVYARIGGVTVLSEPELSFTLTLDRRAYDPGALMNVRLSLRSTLEEALELTFPSGQKYDLTIRDEKGDVVYRWSDGKAFTLALVTERIHGERNYAVEIPLRARDESPLPPGRYTAEGLLTTIGAIRQFQASVGFEIRGR